MKVNRGHGLNGFLKVAHSEPVSTPPPPQGGGQRGTLGARRGSRGTVSGLLPHPPSSLHIPALGQRHWDLRKARTGGCRGVGAAASGTDVERPGGRLRGASLRPPHLRARSPANGHRQSQLGKRDLPGLDQLPACLSCSSSPRQSESELAEKETQDLGSQAGWGSQANARQSKIPIRVMSCRRGSDQ